MGSSINTAINNTIQTSTNSVFQSATNICKANCTSELSGGSIIIAPGATVGGVKIEAKCTSDALCTMKTQLNTIATQQLDAVQIAVAEDPGRAFLVTWPGFSVNTTINNSVQTLSNSVTQVINNVCVANSSNLISNYDIYVGANAEVGLVEISLEGSAQANCAIENTVSTDVSQETSSSQEATSIGGSALVTIILILTIGVVLVALAWIAAESKKNQNMTNVELAKSGASAEVIQAITGIPTISEVESTSSQ